MSSTQQLRFDRVPVTSSHRSDDWYGLDWLAEQKPDRKDTLDLALILPGGGVRTAYQAGILLYLFTHYHISLRTAFVTSGGAPNAGALVSGMVDGDQITAKQNLIALWRRIGLLGDFGGWLAYAPPDLTLEFLKVGEQITSHIYDHPLVYLFAPFVQKAFVTGAPPIYVNTTELARNTALIYQAESVIDIAATAAHSARFNPVRTQRGHMRDGIEAVGAVNGPIDGLINFLPNRGKGITVFRADVWHKGDLGHLKDGMKNKKFFLPNDQLQELQAAAPEADIINFRPPLDRNLPTDVFNGGSQRVLKLLWAGYDDMAEFAADHFPRSAKIITRADIPLREIPHNPISWWTEAATATTRMLLQSFAAPPYHLADSNAARPQPAQL